MTYARVPTIKFWVLTTLTLLGAATLLAELWPQTLAAARQQSASLANQGAQANGNEAEVDYQLATWLDPNNHTAFAGLARAQIAAGRADDALATLGQAGEGSEVEQLKVRTLIELGRYSQAADEAAHLTAPDRTEADLVLAGLACALADRTADIEALMPRVTSPEAAKSLRQAQAGKVTLAAELHATGLLESSSALLTKQPPSYERNLLLARIRYTRHTPANLAQAADYLTAATGLNPAGLEARQLLVQVYRDQSQSDAAAAQTALISKLQSGRP